MEYYLLIARSVTRAQKMDAELRKRGIHAEVSHAPAGLTDKGCAYGLKISPRRAVAAMRILRSKGLELYRIYVYNGSDLREVEL